MKLHPRIKLLFWIKEKGEVTRKTQPYFVSTIGYYLALKYLRDKGLIELSRTDGNVKYWKLSKKGENLVRLLEKVMEVLNDG